MTAPHPTALRQPSCCPRVGGAPNDGGERGAPREVQVGFETGKVLRILTDDLTARAQEIANFYKRRCAIELFFRWVKQALKISCLLGTSENAVRHPSGAPSSCTPRLCHRGERGMKA
jgi:hypothetical protein